jgi:hypothetical protein
MGKYVRVSRKMEEFSDIFEQVAVGVGWAEKVLFCVRN